MIWRKRGTTDFKVINFVPFLDHAWGDEDLFILEDSSGQRIRVSIFRHRTDGRPLRASICPEYPVKDKDETTV